MRLLICKACKKPDKASVKGKPMKGKKLCQQWGSRHDLPFRVESCACLGKCKKGPNGLLLPQEKRLYRLSPKAIEELAAAYSAIPQGQEPSRRRLSK